MKQFTQRPAMVIASDWKERSNAGAGLIDDIASSLVLLAMTSLV